MSQGTSDADQPSSDLIPFSFPTHTHNANKIAIYMKINKLINNKYYDKKVDTKYKY